MKLYCILMVEKYQLPAHCNTYILVPSKVYQQVEGYFFINNTEELSMMLKGIDFDAEDLMRVVSALGEIKKKKGEWKKLLR